MTPRALLLACATLLATTAHAADLVPDAVELPLYTRHLANNQNFNNHTPGIGLQWATPWQVAGSHAVRVQAALYKNSFNDPTSYLGLHAEWHVSGRLYAGGGAGATYGYKRMDYTGNAWLEGKAFCIRNFCGRRYEKRQLLPSLQLDARYEIDKTWSATAKLVIDRKLCRKQEADAFGITATACAVVLGVRAAW